MSRDAVMRGALWATVALNTFGVLIFGQAALGRESRLLPVPVPPVYAAQIGFVILLFGVVYAWIALQPRIDRRLVLVGAAGKLGFFALTAAYAVAGQVPMSMAVNAAPDLVFASIFLWWALD